MGKSQRRSLRLNRRLSSSLRGVKPPETKIEDASGGQETAGLVPTKTRDEASCSRNSQGGAVKEQDQPTSATKTTEAKSPKAICKLCWKTNS